MSARPNILLLVADQHRWDATGAAGRFAIRTPHIDRLAAEGAFFEHAFTPMPVCAPARQALLSGIAPDSLGALWNNDFIPTPTVQPDPGYHTAALARAGWRCALLGKWNSSTTHSPADFGFRQHIGWQEHAQMTAGKYPGLSYRSGWFGEPNPVDLEDSKTHWLAGRACEFIRRSSGGGAPWYLRVDFSDPHLPCRPSEPFASLYDPDTIEPWDSFGDALEGKPYIQRQQRVNWNLERLGWDDWKACVARYYGMVSQVDDAVGRVLGCLQSLGILDDTIVIYTTDHGDLCGGHGMLDKHYVLYDDVTRVPLIIRWPRAARAGLRIREYVCNCLDLGATLGELAGLPDVKPGHGRSLAPLIAGGRQPERDCAVISANGQQFGLYSQRAIRTDEWLYVWNMTDTDELYSVPDDPGQKKNLVREPDLTGTVAVLRRRLYAELVRRDDPFAKTGWLSGQLLDGRKL